MDWARNRQRLLGLRHAMATAKPVDHNRRLICASPIGGLAPTGACKWREPLSFRLAGPRGQMINASSSMMPIPITSTASATGS